MNHRGGNSLAETPRVRQAARGDNRIFKCREYSVGGGSKITANVIKERQDRPQPTINVTDGTPEYSMFCGGDRAGPTTFQLEQIERQRHGGGGGRAELSKQTGR
ncbi:hypothetical protein EYF80_026837 [Liparis tanakae]|uniref:Uncharacterized protein n=1 Tax=Liparis tanakae TaxID=230148 RepID=A0A4Z2HAN2_9TELE|nr:hypothetical protein EYF80_026837 [Liparis tanakae]